MQLKDAEFHSELDELLFKDRIQVKIKKKTKFYNGNLRNFDKN